MTGFDYSAPAELFPLRRLGFGRRAISYNRFDTAAAAIRFAVEELDPDKFTAAILEVNEERYDGVAIKNLYASKEYPLARRKAASDDRIRE